MPTQVTPGFHRFQGRAGALVGEAVTATLATTGLPAGTHWVALTARNYSTAVAVGVKMCPWLTILKTQDSGATFTNYSEEAQDDDQDTLVTLSSQDTLANGDALYVGSHVPFRGADIDLNDLNATASVLTVSYPTSSAGIVTWNDISDTDGTIATGASMGQDGAVTWTVPTDWVPSRLNAILGSNVNIPSGNANLFWTRWVFSAALDSSTTLFSMHGLPCTMPVSRDIDGSDTVDYTSLIENATYEMAANRGPGGFGGVAYLTDAGTANLIINVGQGDRDL